MLTAVALGAIAPGSLASARVGLDCEPQTGSASLARRTPSCSAKDGRTAPRAAGNQRCRETGYARSGPTTCGACDSKIDVNDDGRAVKLLVVDEFTPRNARDEAERKVHSDKTSDVLDRIVRTRGSCPQFVRCGQRAGDDLGRAVGIGVRFSRTGTAFIEPGSPWENPVRREPQQPRPRRAPQRRGIQLPREDDVHGRGLPRGLQLLHTRTGAMTPHGGQDRLGGPAHKASACQRQSALALRARSFSAGASPTYQPPALTAQWTRDRGPLSRLRRLRVSRLRCCDVTLGRVAVAQRLMLAR